MTSYKLVYFDARGRAELIRLIFAAAGVDFKDERIDHHSWPQSKAETPFGKLPVLYVDGKPLAESMAIVRYLADIFKLVPSKSEGMAFMDAMVCTINDLIFKLPFMEQDETKKAQAAQEHLANKLGPAFEKMEKAATKYGGKFMEGETLCYGDLAIFAALETVCSFDETFVQKFPKLKEIAMNVSKAENIKKYIENRRKTKF